MRFIWSCCVSVTHHLKSLFFTISNNASSNLCCLKAPFRTSSSHNTGHTLISHHSLGGTVTGLMSCNRTFSVISWVSAGSFHLSVHTDGGWSDVHSSWWLANSSWWEHHSNLTPTVKQQLLLYIIVIESQHQRQQQALRVPTKPTTRPRSVPESWYLSLTHRTSATWRHVAGIHHEGTSNPGGASEAGSFDWSTKWNHLWIPD